MKKQVFIIEAGFTGSYYAPHLKETFSTIKWEAKHYTNEANANRAIYAMRFNPAVKTLNRQGINLRARPLKTEFLQLSLF